MNLIATRNRKEIEKRSPELIVLLEKENAILMRAYCSMVKGLTAFFFNQYDDALIQFKEVLELVPKNDDICGIAKMGMGFTNRSIGHLDEAVTNLSEATQLIDQNGDFGGFMSYCYQSLGDIHISIEEFGVAIEYISKAYEISEGESDKAAYFRYHMGLGVCYLKMRDYENSKEHFITALDVEGRPAPMLSRVQNDLGELYLETKEYDKAEELLKKSLGIRQANNLEDAACTTMTTLSKVYLESNRTEEALMLLDKCRLLVDKYHTDWKKIKVLQLLALANGRLGNYKEALGIYEEYINLFDQVKGGQERNILKYKNEQIESQRREIEEKHRQLSETLDQVKRLKVNRKAVIFSLVTIAVLVIISELFLDPIIEDYSYNTMISLSVKVGIALLFKPIDGLYANLLWRRTLQEMD